jgi:chitinase
LSRAPPVTITAPTTDSVLTAPASFTLRASVSGGGNNVSQIEFFEGTNSLGVDTDNPYRLDVNNLPAGT